jgi:Zn finger protein HypA/HybF involved in hydrogenase expression
MELDRLLERLYSNAPQGSASAMEKTAEAAMLAGLTSQPRAARNPYEDMSLEELTKLAQELNAAPAVREVAVEQEAAGSAAASEDEELQKVAFDMLAGQIMAHAMIHESKLIKVAYATGTCRVCKENALDVEGSSICSACGSGE